MTGRSQQGQSRILILFYSKTGRTRLLAHRLAEALGADIEEIACQRYEGGFLRYLLAGYDSLKGNLAPVHPPAKNPADYDLVLLGFPIWTSYAAVPIRSYLSGNPELPERVAVFSTYGGQSNPEQALPSIERPLRRPVFASLFVKNKEENTKATLAEEEAFVSAILNNGETDESGTS